MVKRRHPLYFIFFLMFSCASLISCKNKCPLGGNIIPYNSDPSNYTIYNNKLYFTATNETHGRKIWVFDGINNPYMLDTAELNDIDFYPYNLMVHNNSLYFFVSISSTTEELWKYNENTGIERIFNNDSSNSKYLETSGSYNDLFYFFVSIKDVGIELWTYDEHSQPEMKFTLSGIYHDSVYGRIIYNNRLYFTVCDKANTVKLYEYDFINQPKTIFEFHYQNTYYLYSPNFIVFNNILHFCTATYNNCEELWAYDGLHVPYTTSGILQESKLSNWASSEFFNNKFYYSINNETNNQISLWAYNGIDSSQLIYDFTIDPNFDYIHYLVQFNNNLYLFMKKMDTAGEITYKDGFDIWRYDGIGTPEKIKHVSGSQFNFVLGHIVFNNRMYFSACNDSSGCELWIFDGKNYPFLGMDINSGSTTECNGNFD